MVMRDRIVRFSLAGMLSHEDAERLHRTLDVLVEHGKELEIELNDVTAMHETCFNELVSASVKANEMGKKIHFLSDNAQLVEVINLLSNAISRPAPTPLKS